MTPPVQPVPGQPGPTQPQFLTGAQLNMRIQHGDTAFPKELWGRTVGEAMRYYAIMREDFVNRNNPMNQPAPRAPEAAPAAPSFPAPGAPTNFTPRPPAPAPVLTAPPAFDEERLLGRMMEMMRAEIGKSPAVIVAADTVKDRVAKRYPDFAHYEQQVLEELRGSDPSILAQESTWETAYFYVRGRAQATGQGLPPVPAPVPNGGTHYGPRGELISPPPPPMGVHFVEAPAGAPPATTMTGAADPRLDPVNISMARRFGIPIDEYVQWLGGNVPAMPGAR